MFSNYTESKPELIEFDIKTKGSHQLVLEYNRDGVDKIVNSITIHSITIVGSNHGGGISCHQCPKGKYKPGNHTVTQCLTCPRGYTSSNDSILNY